MVADCREHAGGDEEGYLKEQHWGKGAKHEGWRVWDEARVWSGATSKMAKGGDCGVVAAVTWCLLMVMLEIV